MRTNKELVNEIVSPGGNSWKPPRARSVGSFPGDGLDAAAALADVVVEGFEAQFGQEGKTMASSGDSPL